jgi:hypothetical protein
MAKDLKKPEQGLSNEEMQAEQTSELPDRQAMQLLDLDANLDLALDLAAPIDAAIAANANASIPLNASVGANVIGIGSTAASAANQEAQTLQQLEGTANATATQLANIDQGDDMSGP